MIFTNSTFHFFCFVFTFIAYCTSVQANDNSQSFGQYSVHYSVFDSTFVLPDVAASYGIKRSKYESLLNISVSKNGLYGGIPVEIHGTVKNLLQQQTTLKFKTIKEENTVYYIAPIRVGNKEVVHFEIHITPENATGPLVAKFTKTLYADK